MTLVAAHSGDSNSSSEAEDGAAEEEQNMETGDGSHSSPPHKKTLQFIIVAIHHDVYIYIIYICVHVQILALVSETIWTYLCEGTPGSLFRIT